VVRVRVRHRDLHFSSPFNGKYSGVRRHGQDNRAGAGAGADHASTGIRIFASTGNT
jgi:hypothetical protein